MPMVRYANRVAVAVAVAATALIEAAVSWWPYQPQQRFSIKGIAMKLRRLLSGSGVMDPGLG